MNLYMSVSMHMGAPKFLSGIILSHPCLLFTEAESLRQTYRSDTAGLHSQLAPMMPLHRKAAIPAWHLYRLWGPELESSCLPANTNF